MPNFNDLISDETKNEIVNYLKEITGEDNYVKFVKLDDKFDFQCQQCGECCMHRGDIILTGWDVFKAARSLGITTKKFIHKYTQRCLGQSSKAPMIVLSSESNGFCPFLKYDYLDGCKFSCEINDAKPSSCMNHPIGLVIPIDKECSDATDKLDYNFVKVKTCDKSQGHNNIHTVREWMKPFFEQEEEALCSHELSSVSTRIINWTGLLIMTGLFSTAVFNNDINKKDISFDHDLALDVYAALCSSTVFFCYENYDTNENALDFVEQTESNRNAIFELFNYIKTDLYDDLKQVFNRVMSKTLDELLKEGENTNYEEQIKWVIFNKPTFDKETTDEVIDIYKSFLSLMGEGDD